MNHQCTDATLDNVGPGLYRCLICEREHRAGRDLQRCHGCCKLFPTSSLRRRRVRDGGGSFCSVECEDAFAKLRRAEAELAEALPSATSRLGETRIVRCPDPCGVEFETADPWQKFCCTRCTSRASGKAFRERKRQAKEQAS